MAPANKTSAKFDVTGEVVARVPGFVLVRTASAKPSLASSSQRAETLIPKLAQALNRPGLSTEAVFKGQTDNVYSYSVDVTDITRVVRVSADGRRSVGRLVGEEFVQVNAD